MKWNKYATPASWAVYYNVTKGTHKGNTVAQGVLEDLVDEYVTSFDLKTPEEACRFFDDHTNKNLLGKCPVVLIAENKYIDISRVIKPYLKNGKSK